MSIQHPRNSWRRQLAGALAGVGFVALSGCVVAPVEQGYAYGDYDNYVYDHGGYYAGGGDGYYNNTYYPAIPHEVVPVAPFVGALWITGYWDISRGNRRWVPGHYERPRPNVRPGWSAPNNNNNNNPPHWNQPSTNNRPNWSQPPSQPNNRPGWNNPTPGNSGGNHFGRPDNKPNDNNRPSFSQPTRPGSSGAVIAPRPQPNVNRPTPSTPSGTNPIPIRPSAAPNVFKPLNTGPRNNQQDRNFDR